jgi:OPT oligopeptide transporter protein
MNKGLEKYVPTEIPVNVQSLPQGVALKGSYSYEGKTYRVINSLGSTTIPDGDYLYDSGTQRIEIQWVHGIGSDKAAAPQARLMATVINGILNQRLPWRLVLMGVALVAAIELLGVRSLAFAVGSYLSIATTAAIFAGGLVRWIVEQSSKEAKSESEASPGALYSSGLIAAGGVFGLLAIAINLLQDPEIPNHVPHWLSAVLRLPWRADLLAFGPKLLGSLSQSNLFGLVMFILLAISLFHFGRKKLN